LNDKSIMAVVRAAGGKEMDCPSCGRTMRPVGTAAHAGRLGELRTYECKACGVLYTEAADAKDPSARGRSAKS
jgi:C4-type Zn-finger protein